MSEIRVRFAPSPTGFLHVGGARTALFNWLWARHNGGKFIIRIEDTDVERSTDASTEQILDSLKWLGLDWDEGPFYQSQRLEIYQQHLEKLRQSGHIYPAFESREELDAARKQAEQEKRDFIYDRASLKLSPEEVQQRIDSGAEFVWRFKVPDGGFTVVEETLMGGEGGSRFENAKIDDFIITRPGTKDQPGMPLYNFVCTIDDALMGITHVIRGVEHLSNAAKQVLMYEALGYDVPTFTHLPLVMKNGKKMSKRDEEADPRFPVSVSARRDVGYLKEAMVNFLALLGCSYGSDEEIMDSAQLIEKFDITRLNKSNANFDEDKFLHFNGTYLRSLPRKDVIELVKPHLKSAGYDIDSRSEEWLAGIIEMVIERCTLLSDFPPALDFFFAAPTAYEAKGVKKAFGEGSADTLEAVSNHLGSVEEFSKENLESELRKLSEKLELGFGKVAQPVRMAITGRMASPGLFEVLESVGRDESVKRLNRAAELIRSESVPEK